MQDVTPIVYSESFPPLEATYRNLLEFCARDGVPPIPYERWLTLREVGVSQLEGADGEE